MRRVARDAALAAILLAAMACGDSPEPAEQPLEGLPDPTAGDVVESALQQFAEARQRVAEAAGGDDEALGEALGSLGRLYLVHEYPDAALECFLRARRRVPGEAEWPYLAGYVRQLAGDLEAAGGLFETALELHPDDPAVLYRLGEVALDGNRPDAAADRFRRLLELQPDSAAGHYGLGRAALAQREHALAIRHLDAALTAQPEATKIHHLLGLAYRGLGEMEKAQNHLARRGDGEILLTDPWIAEIEMLANVGTGHLRSGLEASRQGDRRRAASEFRAALEDDPEDLIARFNLAVSLSRQGDTAGAEREYREVLRRDPDNSQAAFNLGSMLAKQNRLEEAIELLRRALDGAADFKQARMNLAAALSRAGRWQEAVEQYDILLERDPESASARSLRSLAMVQAGRANEGLAELRELLRNDPTDITTRVTLISALLRLGDRAAAFEEIDAGVAAAGGAADRALIQFESAKVLAMLGDVEEAVARLRSARQLDPGLTEAARTLGELLLRVGEPGEAAVQFRQVVEQQPQSVTARLAEVHSLWRHGDCAAAFRRLEGGREVMPRSAELAHALARLLATCPQAGVRDGERALALARDLSAARPTGAHTETLAMALAESGQFAEAVDVQSRLLAAARWNVDARVLRRLTENLERYRRREPVRLNGLEP